MRANCEWLRVEVVDAGTAIVSVAHNPYASFSRSVKPWVLRHFANLVPATGLEFVKRLSSVGCELDLVDGNDGEPMTSERCVTRWRFKVVAA